MVSRAVGGAQRGLSLLGPSCLHLLTFFTLCPPSRPGFSSCAPLAHPSETPTPGGPVSPGMFCSVILPAGSQGSFPASLTCTPGSSWKLG